MEMYEGEIDYEKLATGKYIVYGLERKADFLEYVGAVSDEWKYFNVGDKVTLDSVKGQNTYEIMAICIVNHTYSEQNSYTYAGHGLTFYLPTDEYMIYGNDDVMRYLFNTQNSKMIDDELQGIGFESRRGWREEYLGDMEDIRKGALVFAFGCVGVGFFVFINTLIISYLDRKKEFDVLSSIGMTSKQIKLMILGECGKIASDIDFDKKYLSLKGYTEFIRL